MTGNMLSNDETQVEDIIDEVEKLPPEQKQLVTRKLEIYQGDLPHPDILEGYFKLYPDAPKKIIENGIAETEHRRMMEKKYLNSQIFAHNLGQYLGFAIALVIIIGGIYLIINNHAITGSILSGTSAIGVIGMFTNSSKDN